MELRDYQTRCLDVSLARYRAGTNRQLAVLATALGKTVVFANLRSHHEFRRKVMVLVHREELAAQAADKIGRWNAGLMIGIEMAGRRAAPMDTFVVGSVPTLGRHGSKRLEKFDPEEFDCVVCDESHHAISSQFRYVLDHFGLMHPGGRILSLGVTATPNRGDGKGLKACYDEIVFDMGINAGIGQGYLVDLRCFSISTTTSLEGVHTSAGDFKAGELSDAINNPERNSRVVKAWADKANGKKTLAFTAGVQHALDLAETFKAAGISSEAVWGEDPDRTSKLARHRAGEIRVLTNCFVIAEGYDDPGIECIVLARPTKSALLLTQMIGRGTRLPEGRNHIADVREDEKSECLILDMCDVTASQDVATVPSLLGLPKKLDMEGRTYRDAQEQIDRVAKEFPMANLADLRNMSKLDHIAKEVELFKVSYPPEVSRLTELAWRKQGDGYFLNVKRDRVTLAPDLLQEWWVRGELDGHNVEVHCQNLAGAFNAADNLIIGPERPLSLLKRDSHWRDMGPSEKQLALCRKMGITVPNGATRGMVSSALDAKFHGTRV